MTQAIRDKAKELGIKSWHVKAIDKLEAEIVALAAPVEGVLNRVEVLTINPEQLAKELSAQITVVDAYGIGLYGRTNAYVNTKGKTYDEVLKLFKEMGV